jgi:hypothetical protein
VLSIAGQLLAKSSLLGEETGYEERDEDPKHGQRHDEPSANGVNRNRTRMRVHDERSDTDRPI